MKFISKFSNYMITLRPGIPSEPLTGRGAVSGLYIRFQDGEAEVKEDTEIFQLLTECPAYKVDFWPATAENIPTMFRKPNEPEHDVTEIVYGHVGKSMNPKLKASLSDDQKAIVQDMIKTEAKKMAMEMLKEMSAQFKEAQKVSEIKNEPVSEKTELSNEYVSDKIETPSETPESVVGKRGRPKQS